MLVIDGSAGEGGGQVLRTSLSLSLVSGTPFRIERIRGNRRKPGLLRQHLTAVGAAARVGGASVDGAELGASTLTFRPGRLSPGEHHFAVGTAGSAVLVLQTILPPLLTAGAPSRIVLEGGTHNPMAPPFDFLERVFLPVIGRMGPTVRTALERRGFFPAGGGRFTVSIEPTSALAPVEILERGRLVSGNATAIVAHLPRSIAERELRVVARRMGWDEGALHAEEDASSEGPGNVLFLELEWERSREIVTEFGERSRRAEDVAEDAAASARRLLESGAVVGPHLADQLLVPLAVAGGGRFRTVEPTTHFRTNAAVIESFLGRRIHVETVSETIREVRVEG